MAVLSVHASSNRKWPSRNQGNAQEEQTFIEISIMGPRASSPATQLRLRDQVACGSRGVTLRSGSRLHFILIAQKI